MTTVTIADQPGTPVRAGEIAPSVRTIVAMHRRHIEALTTLLDDDATGLPPTLHPPLRAEHAARTAMLARWADIGYALSTQIGDPPLLQSVDFATLGLAALRAVEGIYTMPESAPDPTIAETDTL